MNDHAKLQGQQALAASLMNTAVCSTTHPADAAAALILGAGLLLEKRFGPDGALALMHSAIEETGQLLAQVQRPTATVQ